MEKSIIRPFKEDGYISWINEKDEIDLQYPVNRNFDELVKYINSKKVYKLRIESYAWQKEDLEDLKYFSNIRSISISSSFISDFSGLSNLNNLRELSFGDNVKAKIDLSVVPNLESLSFFFDKQHLLNLENCTKLITLGINNFKPENKKKTTISSKLKIQTLSLGKFNPKSKDFSMVESLPNLKKLSIYTTSIQSMFGIGKFENLEEVKFFGANKLTDICNVGELKEVNKIWIENAKKIRNHQHLKNCNQLNNLRLINCGFVENLKWIENLTKLEELVLTKSIIEDRNLYPLLGRHWQYLYLDDRAEYTHKLSEIVPKK